MLKQKRNALRRVLALNLGEEMKGYEKQISVNIWNQLGWIFENCSVRWPREKKVLHSECHELIFQSTELWRVKPSWLRQKRLQKSKRRTRIYFWRKNIRFSMLSNFWANGMVDSLESFFSQILHFQNWAVHLFWGYRRKTKVEKKRRRVKTQVTGWCWKVKLHLGSPTSLPTKPGDVLRIIAILRWGAYSSRCKDGRRHQWNECRLGGSLKNFQVFQRMNILKSSIVATFIFCPPWLILCQRFLPTHPWRTHWSPPQPRLSPKSKSICMSPLSW